MSLTPSPSSTPQATPLATWTPPAESSDLDCWNVTKFPNGKDKVQVVRGIPFSASATTSSPASTAASTPDHVSPSRSNDTHILQLFYPRNSINPANFPQGGAEFYASPLPGMLNATNVTFEYSTFFPNDFLWMKGGKLPGLFGGHTGCSGGNVADTCFSTRIMWRANGMGELYLYVDKSKQRPNLCTSTPYTSECNPQYGLSLARGSFNFTPGAWTHLKQTVRLNTPGVQDGGFTLDANGVRVLTLDGIFYRGPEPAFGFSGIFFSTFFGGHDPSWASPVDQYVWFKDFKLSVNA
ncbi:uncharacterized protein EI90DRAFT_2930998 [Cantharellus anzutake]|uniref:uncharacterized protein n=1 Tax=Cantharellus anzutake TaxID=1750568 RepID=UPI001908CF0A|nr:uncharacterized protein EI90DRAFT_2930998 [Cantharellus anzutake]KAF8326101.1 hypothetical protein EI90DRAFT_2930998 [Cantharellus anzutake]